MNLTRLMLAFGTLALTVASAASAYKFKVTEPQWVGANQLKPGEYSIQVDGDKAVIKNGKNVVEVPAKVETVPTKFDSTTLFTQSLDGKSNIGEIRFGGTKTKIVFGAKAGGAVAQ